MTKFSEKLYQLRKEHHLSQEEMGNRLAVSRQTISNWENGGAQPSLDKAIELANLFDISLDDLVGHSIETVHNNTLLTGLIGHRVTIFLSPDSNTWFSISKTQLKQCEIISVSPTSITAIINEKKQQVEYTFPLKDIVGIESRGES